MNAKEYRERAHRDSLANADRHDPARMLESLKLQGVPVVQTQMRTLVWDDRAQMERHLRTNPLLGETFICLVREDLERPLDNPPVVGDAN